MSGGSLINSIAINTRIKKIKKVYYKITLQKKLI